MYPGLLDGIQDLQPEHLHGSEFHEEYLRTAPDPGRLAQPAQLHRRAAAQPAAAAPDSAAAVDRTRR